MVAYPDRSPMHLAKMKQTPAAIDSRKARIVRAKEYPKV